jgi:hypothetical protein
MAGFELWDVQSRNLLADFDTEAEALAAVADALDASGMRAVDSLVLLRVGPRGGLTKTKVAAGDKLASLALVGSPPPAKRASA